MKSIIISTPLIPATLDGRKTMTRRTRGLDEINKNPDIWQFLKCDYLDYMTRKSSKGKFGAYFKTENLKPRTINICPVVFPYGQPGDKLFLKEVWRIGAWNENTGELAIDYRADNFCRREWLKITDDDDGEKFNKYWIQCSDDCEKAGVKPDVEGNYHWEPGQSPCRWRSPYFMRREYSRIALEIMNVRVERIQEISEEDAIREGVEYLFTQHEIDTTLSLKGRKIDENGYRNYLWHGNHNAPAKLIDEWEYQYSGYDTAKESFSSLWHLINAKKGFGWNTNCWVWVIEFGRT